MAMIADWMKRLGGYEVVDEKARQRLDGYDEQLPIQFNAVDQKITDVNNDLTEHINAADKKMNQIQSDLTNKIDGVNTNLTKKIDANKTETDADITELNSKLNTMNANLSNAISSALINAKNYTNAEVAEEAESRTAADDKLQDNIDAEAVARLAGDNALVDDIVDEANLRREADNALEKKITSETSARQSADQLLQQNINAETTAREQADNALRNELSGDISAEATAREQADNALSERIDAVNDDIDNLSESVDERVATLEKAIDDAKTGVQNDLINYYLKSETYSRDEVMALINAIPKFAIEVVSTLPTSNISSTTVYLLKTGDESSNIYTEYIYTNSTWESLGTQKVDLSGYATKDELSNYALKSALHNGSASIVWQQNADSANILQLLIDGIVVASLQQGFDGRQFLPLTGGTILNNVTFANSHPIYFTYIGNGTYNIGVLQFEDDGMTIETPRKTDAADGEILPFNIKTRGGQYAPLYAGDMRSNGYKVLTAADITIENGVTIIDLG